MMKKYISICLILLVISSVVVSAAETKIQTIFSSIINADNNKIGNTKKAKNVLKINASSPVVGLFYGAIPIMLTYERAFQNNMSVSISPAVAVGFLGYGIGSTITGRWYPSKTKQTPSGWFLGIPVNMSYVFETNHKFSIYGGITGGYQWIMPKGFEVDAFISPMYGISTNSSGYGYGFPLYGISTNSSVYGSPLYGIAIHNFDIVINNFEGNHGIVLDFGINVGYAF